MRRSAGTKVHASDINDGILTSIDTYQTRNLEALNTYTAMILYVYTSSTNRIDHYVSRSDCVSYQSVGRSGTGHATSEGDASVISTVRDLNGHPANHSLNIVTSDIGGLLESEKGPSRGIGQSIVVCITAVRTNEKSNCSWRIPSLGRWVELPRVVLVKEEH